MALKPKSTKESHLPTSSDLTLQGADTSPSQRPTTVITKIKRTEAAKHRDRRLAMPRLHQAGNTRFTKWSQKGRVKCARLDVKLANSEGRRFDAEGREKEAVDRRGGFWSAYLDTLFRDQTSP